MDQVPLDIIENFIIPYLDLADYASFIQTCKRLYEMKSTEKWFYIKYSDQLD